MTNIMVSEGYLCPSSFLPESGERKLAGQVFSEDSVQYLPSGLGWRRPSNVAQEIMLEK